MSNVHYISWH